MVAGCARVSGWWRWLPVYVSPVFSDNRHPFLTANGVAVGVFGRVVYVARR